MWLPDDCVRAFLKRQGLWDSRSQPRWVPFETDPRWEKTRNPRQSEGRLRFIGARGERRHFRLVEINRTATVVSISENFNAGDGSNDVTTQSASNPAEYGLRSRRLFAIVITVDSAYNSRRASEPWTNGRTSPVLMNPIFFWIMWTAGYVWVFYQGTYWYQNVPWHKNQRLEGVWCFGECSGGKDLVRSFMWTTLCRPPPMWTSLQTRCISS